MTNAFTEARKRPAGSPGRHQATRTAGCDALARSQAYQDAADAPGDACGPMRPTSRTTRLGATGTVSSPCPRHPRWSGPIWRRPAKAMRCRPCAVELPPLPARVALQDILSTPSILRSARRSAASGASTAVRRGARRRSPRRRSRSCVGRAVADLAGARDRALLLLGFAGALRRSELVALDVEHVTLDAQWVEAADRAFKD